MATAEELDRIKNLTANARAQLTVLKKDTADAQRAGLKDAADMGSRQVVELEKKISALEAVYGRA